MALTAAQSAAKTYLTTSADVYTFQGTPDAVADWYTLGADNAVIALMNDLAFGASLGVTASVPELEHSLVKRAIIDSADFDTMRAAPGVISSLQWAITENPVTKATLQSAGQKILGTTYPAAKAAVLALLTAAATKWQAINDTTGAPAFTQADLTAIRNEP